LKELHFNSSSWFTHQLEEVGMAIDLFVNATVAYDRVVVVLPS